MYTILKDLFSQLEHKFHEDKKFVLLAAGTPEQNLTQLDPQQIHLVLLPFAREPFHLKSTSFIFGDPAFVMFAYQHLSAFTTCV